MENKEKQGARIFFLQVKVTKKVKKKLTELADSNDRSVAEIIRAALYFGIPMLEKVLEMENKLTSLLQKEIDPSPNKRGRPLKSIFDKYR